MAAQTQFGEDMCMGLFAGITFGRVSLNVRAMPRIVPVRISVHRRRINAHLQCDEDLCDALEGAVVALQADGCDDETRRAWSVHAVGRVLARCGPDFVIDPTVLEGGWLDG
jgi:hypothetical protein